MEKRIPQLDIQTFYNNVIGQQVENLEGLQAPVPAAFYTLFHQDSTNGTRHGLELGYGYGQYSVALAEAGYKVDAIDVIDPSFFRERMAEHPNKDAIQITQLDARSFDPLNRYDFIVIKDVLHYFNQEEVKSLLGRLIERSTLDSVHYLVIFSGIRRQKGGVPVHIEGEASFTNDGLTEMMTTLYNSWRVEMVTEPYSEAKDATTPYFRANKNTLICRRIL
ncbi:MAG: class I SAM-dependent methyltransferase [Patescibacteria group bacterium]